MELIVGFDKTFYKLKHFKFAIFGRETTLKDKLRIQLSDTTTMLFE